MEIDKAQSYTSVYFYITFTKLEPPDVATVYSQLNTKEVYAERLYPAESDIYSGWYVVNVEQSKPNNYSLSFRQLAAAIRIQHF